MVVGADVTPPRQDLDRRSSVRADIRNPVVATVIAEHATEVVVQSSVSVSGASPRDPALFSEDLQPRVPPRTGFGKDSVEVES